MKRRHLKLVLTNYQCKYPLQYPIIICWFEIRSAVWFSFFRLLFFFSTVLFFLLLVVVVFYFFSTLFPKHKMCMSRNNAWVVRWIFPVTLADICYGQSWRPWALSPLSASVTWIADCDVFFLSSSLSPSWSRATLLFILFYKSHFQIYLHFLKLNNDLLHITCL